MLPRCSVYDSMHTYITEVGSEQFVWRFGNSAKYTIITNSAGFALQLPSVGSGVVRIYPLRFLAGCYKRRLNQALSVLYLSMFFIVLLFIMAPFHVSLISICIGSVFWLFWLSCQYLPSDWLERLLWGSLTMARGLSPQSTGRGVFTIFLV